MRSRGINVRTSKPARSISYKLLCRRGKKNRKNVKRRRDINNINHAVRFLTQAIAQIPERSQRIPGLLNRLGEALNGRFQLLGGLGSLEKAISCWANAAKLAPGKHSGPSDRLIGLGDSMYRRFDRLGKIEDLDKAIAYQRQAVSLTTHGHPEFPTRLESLSISFYDRFEQLGELTDLDKAIEYGNQGVSLTPPGHLDLPERLSNLSVFLYIRSDRRGELADLDKAIEYDRQAVLLTPPGHSDLPERLGDLSASLHTRFQQLGELADLDQSIEYGTRSISLTPPSHLDLPEQLSSFSVFLHVRFQRLGELSDLDQAIECESRAVSLTPQGHSDLPERLSQLSVSLKGRFGRLGEIADLDKAIEYGNQAVLLTPQDHSHLPDRLSRLSNLSHSRFDHLGELADLEKAIDYDRQAVSLTPSGDSDLPERISCLSTSLYSRFQRLGELADLDKAIEYDHQAVSLTPPGHPDLPERLSSLSASLHVRFERLGELADIDKAIEYDSQAVSLTPPGYSDLPRRLCGLSGSLHSRFERLGQISDLEKTIEYASQAVSLAPQGHSDLPWLLKNLGFFLHSRFKQSGDLADLDKAIEHNTKAVSLTPPGHPDFPERLSGLSASLHARFERLGKLSDLNKAIDYSSQVVSLTPSDHMELPRRLNDLSEYRYTRFLRLSKILDVEEETDRGLHVISPTLGCKSDPPLVSNDSDQPYGHWSNLPGIAEDLCHSIDCSQMAAESSVGSPGEKFVGALQWATKCTRHRPSASLLAYKRVMTILPQLLWLGNAVDSRHRLIVDIGSVRTEAATVAITMQNYQLALEWLEESRSIVWKQILQLRTPMDDLVAVEPTLAAELKKVALDLDHASSPKPLNHTVLMDATSLERAAQQHHLLAERWEELVDQARRLPGFEAFLRPRKASELMQSARTGAVVVINVHKSHCDALIIQPGITEISHIPLGFTSEKAASARVEVLNYVRSRGLSDRAVIFHVPDPKDQFRGMLGLLWKEVVKPVLESLGYLRPTSAGDLPHITWCTAGPLSFLPLHAAGDYDSGDISFRYVVSSYTPTLSALLSPYTQRTTFSGILAVGQEFTSLMNNLPGTVTELTSIQEQSQGHPVMRLDGDLATPEAVMSGMEKHSWVHLACHALQNPANPMQSAFYLHGGMLDLATITQKRLKNTELAFLSACQTATGDESLSEEAVHLAAGMLMAGYRTVIATMWSISDEDAPLVAEKVYKHLMEGGTPDSRRAAVAVHRATECLRAKVGVEAFEKWVPYIHIGQ